MKNGLIIEQSPKLACRPTLTGRTIIQSALKIMNTDISKYPFILKIFVHVARFVLHLNSFYLL